MDTDELKGRGKRMGGKAEEATGDVTGNESMEARGRARQDEGRVQELFGNAKEAFRDMTRKIRGR